MQVRIFTEAADEFLCKNSPGFRRKFIRLDLHRLWRFVSALVCHRTDPKRASRHSECETPVFRDSYTERSCVNSRPVSSAQPLPFAENERHLPSSSNYGKDSVGKILWGSETPEYSRQASTMSCTTKPSLCRVRKDHALEALRLDRQQPHVA
jgi:hypothetical protein